MLIGEYESKLTDKNRVAVPKKFRDLLKANLILTRGYEKCLILVDESRWKKLIKSIEVRPLLNASVRDLKRYLIGGAYEIDLDVQGRFVMANPLKEFANITNEIMFVGIDDWIEIWDKREWQAKIINLNKNVADIAERLSEIND